MQARQHTNIPPLPLRQPGLLLPAVSPILAHVDQHPPQHRVLLCLIKREVLLGALDVCAELLRGAEATGEQALPVRLHEVVDVEEDAFQNLQQSSA